MDGATVTVIVGLAGVLGGVFAASLTFRGQRLSTEQERVAMLFEAQDKMLSTLRRSLEEVEHDLEEQRVLTHSSRIATLTMIGLVHEVLTMAEGLLPGTAHAKKVQIQARIAEIRSQLEYDVMVRRDE